MRYCRQCGAALPDDTKYCSECGAPVSSTAIRNAEAEALPQFDYPVQNTRRRRKKKSVFQRFWFWLLAIIIAGSVYGYRNLQHNLPALVRKAETVLSHSPAPSANPTAQPSPAAAATPTEKPSPIPTAEPQTKAPVVSESELRPEIKEFLDAYEACMDEYVAFMQKYMKADPVSMVSMMGDYTRILTRYTEFAEKMDAFDESELTNAELAYYIEVNSRVSQKLLLVAGE